MRLFQRYPALVLMSCAVLLAAAPCFAWHGSDPVYGVPWDKYDEKKIEYAGEQYKRLATSGGAEGFIDRVDYVRYYLENGTLPQGAALEALAAVQREREGRKREIEELMSRGEAEYLAGLSVKTGVEYERRVRLDSAQFGAPAAQSASDRWFDFQGSVVDVAQKALYKLLKEFARSEFKANGSEGGFYLKAGGPDFEVSGLMIPLFGSDVYLQGGGEPKYVLQGPTRFGRAFDTGPRWRVMSARTPLDAAGYPLLPLAPNPEKGYYAIDKNLEMDSGQEYALIVNTAYNNRERAVYFDTADHAFERAGVALRIKAWYNDGTHHGIRNYCKEPSKIAFFLKKTLPSGGNLFQVRDEYMIEIPSPIDERLLLEFENLRSHSGRLVAGAFMRLVEAAGVTTPFEPSAEGFAKALNPVQSVAANRFALDLMLEVDGHPKKVGFLLVDFVSNDLQQVAPLAPANAVKMQYELELLPEHRNTLLRENSGLRDFLSRLESTLPGTVDFTPKYLQLLRCENLLLKPNPYAPESQSSPRHIGRPERTR